MVLYWREGLKVVEHLFSNPVFATCMEFTPYRLFDENGRPVISEFMSSQFAWTYQVSISTHILTGSVCLCVLALTVIERRGRDNRRRDTCIRQDTSDDWHGQ